MFITARANKVVSVLLLLSLISAILAVTITYDIPQAFASQDLIVNGGFETADFKGWGADATCKVRPHSVKEGSYEPAHEGRYSARIGTENVKGSLSQTITIPEKSKAFVSFWYRVEKGSSLTFYLRETDGASIQSWAFREESAWTLFNYEIGPQYGGESIVLVFEGKGFSEWKSEPVWVLTDQGWILLYRQVKHSYWPYVDDVSVIHEIAVYDVIVKISGLPSSLSTRIFVDGGDEHSIRGGESKTFNFTFGEGHQFKVEDYVYESEDIRYFCKSSVETASSDATITFDYIPQYRLTIESLYGETEGSGWFNKGYTARFSVSPVTIPIEGLLGTLGAKHVFEGWMGDLSESSPSCEARMDSPKRVTAVWKSDYSNVYMVLGGLGAAIAGISFFTVFRRKTKPQKEIGEEISKAEEFKPKMQIKVFVEDSGKVVRLEAQPGHTLGSLIETVVTGLELPQDLQYALKLEQREFAEEEFSMTLESAGVKAGDQLELISKPEETPEKIAEFKHCFNCGEKLPSDAEYCSRCGEKQE